METIDNILQLTYTLPTMPLITNALSEYKVSLKVFEGPLDLLLRLIECEELDITEVSLAVVTDQYLAHLAELRSRSAANLADFLAVAARLLVIKSRVLLPNTLEESDKEQLREEEEEWERNLVSRLREYKRFKEVAGRLRAYEEAHRRSYARLAATPKTPSLPPQGTGDPKMLRRAFRQALQANPQAKPMDDVVSPIDVHIVDCVRNVLHHVGRRKRVRFSTLMAEARSWLEVIVTFIAVLELVKQKRVSVAQKKLFGEIYLRAMRSSNNKHAPNEG